MSDFTPPSRMTTTSPLPITPVPLADLERSLERLGGDQSLLRDMAGFFIEDAPLLVDQVREAAGRGDRLGIASAAHSLKGLAATFDAAPLLEVTRRVEEQATRSDPCDFVPVVAALDEQTGRLIQFLKQHLLA
jgi:HPt (histidine-containing phosphotransfer) domain-containing protein